MSALPWPTDRPASREERAALVAPAIWPIPEPLPAALPSVAQFDDALLPDSLRPWVTDITERIQCPPDFPAVTMMVSLSAVVGRKIGIWPKRQDDWLEVPNLWGLIVGSPSVLKSPALRAGMAPLHKLDAKAMEAFDLDRQAWTREAELHKIRQEAKRVELRKAAGKRDVTADELLSDFATEEPQPRRYQVNDTSVEALGEILRFNPNGVLAYRDELVGLLKSLDKEGNEGARAFFLSCWNGQEGYIFDRITRGLNLRIEACCLSMLGGIQPAIFGEYLQQAVANAGGDGLVARFQLLVYPDISGDWRNVDRWPDSTARQAANAVFERLDTLDPAEIGATPGDIPALRFNDDARQIFADWHTKLEGRIRDSDEHPAIIAHLAKYRGLVPKLALLNHLADANTGPVGESSILRALAWAEYLETHARRAYASIAQADVSAARALLKRIQKGDLPPMFRLREVYRNGWACLASPDQARRAVELLLDHDYLVGAEIETGGRRATVYTVNPRAQT